MRRNKLQEGRGSLLYPVETVEAGEWVTVVKPSSSGLSGSEGGIRLNFTVLSLLAESSRECGRFRFSDMESGAMIL